MIAAFYVYRTHYAFVGLPLLILATCAFVTLMLGVLYAAGAMRGQTYAILLAVFLGLLTLALILTAGLYLIFQRTRYK